MTLRDETRLGQWEVSGVAKAGGVEPNLVSSQSSQVARDSGVVLGAVSSEPGTVPDMRFSQPSLKGIQVAKGHRLPESKVTGITCCHKSQVAATCLCPTGIPECGLESGLGGALTPTFPPEGGLEGTGCHLGHFC